MPALSVNRAAQREAGVPVADGQAAPSSTWVPLEASPTPLLPRVVNQQLVTMGAPHAGLDDVDGAALIAGLNAYVRTMADLLPVVHANCRRFYDPAAARLRGHSGRHPENVARFVGNALLPGWVATMRQRLADAGAGRHSIGSRESIVVVLLYCRSGRHRAVSASRIVSYDLETVEGIAFFPTRHLTDEGTTRVGGHCDCAACHGPGRHAGRLVSASSGTTWYDRRAAALKKQKLITGLLQG